MRTINTELITQQVKEMCMDVNIHLSKDVKCAIEEAEKKELLFTSGELSFLSDTNLSGYGYDRCIFESWTRGSF